MLKYHAESRSFKGTVENSVLEWCRNLDNNDVPNDGGRYALLTPRQWGMAMLVEEFASAESS